MTNPYGPWATAIDPGRNPQLSSFWRQRLTMLVPVSQTSPVLSRRNLACLFAAGALLIVLPTFHVAGATAEEKKMASENSKQYQGENTAKASSAAKSSDEDSAEYCVISTSSRGALSSSCLVLPISIICALGTENNRKGLQLTSDQEEKLREISRKYVRQHQESSQRTRKELEKVPAEERAAKQREFQARSVQEAKTVRLQVEKLLTAEQWTAVKSIAMGVGGVGRLMSDPHFREQLGVTEQQKEELSRRVIEDAKVEDKGQASFEARKENEKKSLAVITPQQWEQIEQIAGNSDLGMALLSAEVAASRYPGPEWQELNDPDVRKELALSAEQQTKLDEFSAKSRAQCLELSKIVKEENRPLSARDHGAKSAEFQRKLQEMWKRDRERIEGLLTTQQLTALKKLTVRRQILDNLSMSGYFESSNRGQKPSGIFERIKLSKDQMQELCRLGEEKERMMTQTLREIGETALKVLSPQQQDKFFDVIESQGL